MVDDIYIMFTKKGVTRVAQATKGAYERPRPALRPGEYSIRVKFAIDNTVFEPRSRLDVPATAAVGPGVAIEPVADEAHDG